jgi:serine/threonine protein kinase
MSRFHPRTHRKKSHRFHNVDEFTIIRELGRGGYSVVYLVKNIKSGKKYALKCAMKFKKGRDRSARTLQEILVLSELKHTSIIRLVGWFEDEENIYLVLSYVPGRDLSKFFKDKPPSRQLAANIILQIVEGIKYCHSRGVIHRDMKLENILIKDDMNIKITDFGLCAIKTHRDEYFEDEVGTVRYTAPELLTGGGYDESIDVWGIGVILFTLLTGQYPFDGSKKSNIFKRIVRKNIDYSQYDLSDEEINLLKRLLCKNPRYRININDISRHAWFKTHEPSY